ncbi:9573_t:CDS:2 [Diversispora eburnea]|uniref:9573_t:CDS:1 n=1 Tax=Diversispora eburnea TaxID=1213867 RepID=A0A9N8UVG3_9GLOM|nr:9573_t:CDS:2 [Diversispora eburnea]
MPTLHRHLPNITVYAGVNVHNDKISSLNLEERRGAMVVNVDPINNPEAIVHPLSNVSKLLLLIDPLSGKLTRNDILSYARGYINAAKEANVEHIIFPTPFTKLDTPHTPPLTPTDEKGETMTTTESSIINNNNISYRDQFESVELMLKETFPPSQITILRYPGVLNQHLLLFSHHIIEHSKIPLIDNPSTIFEFCDMGDLVRAICNILYCPVQRHGGKMYKITGPNLLTTDEIAVKASLGLGREITPDFLPNNQLYQILSEVIPSKEEVAYLLELWGLQEKNYINGSYNSGGTRRVQVTRDLEMITGVSGTSLRDFFVNNRATFCNKI